MTVAHLRRLPERLRTSIARWQRWMEPYFYIIFPGTSDIPGFPIFPLGDPRDVEISVNVPSQVACRHGNVPQGACNAFARLVGVFLLMVGHFAGGERDISKSPGSPAGTFLEFPGDFIIS